MNHLTAWAITITAFSSGLFGIYKFIEVNMYHMTQILFTIGQIESKE